MCPNATLIIVFCLHAVPELLLGVTKGMTSIIREIREVHVAMDAAEPFTGSLPTCS